MILCVISISRNSIQIDPVFPRLQIGKSQSRVNSSNKIVQFVRLGQENIIAICFLDCDIGVEFQQNITDIRMDQGRNPDEKQRKKCPVNPGSSPCFDGFFTFHSTPFHPTICHSGLARDRFLLLTEQ